MEPAKGIIDKLGGADKVAEIAGCHVSNVYRWTYPKARGGTDGLVPNRYVGGLLSYARTHAIALSAGDFFVVPEASE